MHVSVADKLIFIHNPKTAGRSTIIALGLPDDEHFKLIHMSPAEARRCIFQESWNDYFRFSFVRNPWDRMVSLYEYHKSIGYGIFQRFNASHTLARSYQFDDWVKINLSSTNKSNWFGIPQSLWTNGVSKVYRYEQYDAALQEIGDRIGKKISPLHLNQSHRMNYHSYYEREETIDAVKTIDLDTIKEFCYEY